MSLRNIRQEQPKEDNKPICLTIDYDLYWTLKKQALDKKIPLRKMVHDILRKHMENK